MWSLWTLEGIAMKKLGPAIISVFMLLLLTKTSPRVQAQQGSEQKPETLLRATTRLVLVDIVAVDHAGRPVTNLTENDFSVTENGKPQKISTFVFHSADDDAKA